MNRYLEGGLAALLKENRGGRHRSYMTLEEEEANPGAKPLLHSDRAQYTSREYRMVTTQYQMIRSMSRLGKCIDNAPIESFFGHFKTECYDLKKYKTFEELAVDIDDYIYFYNYQHFQERNNGLVPHFKRGKAVA